jgi:hypothetical protein
MKRGGFLIKRELSIQAISLSSHAQYSAAVFASRVVKISANSYSFQANTTKAMDMKGKLSYHNTSEATAMFEETCDHSKK